MGNILVVEDDSAIQQAMAGLLDLEGYTVVTAGDGEQAMARIREGFRPHVIFVDLMMPKMNGTQFIQALQKEELSPFPRIIVFSGDGQMSQKTKDMSIDVCIMKPVNADVLLELVRRFC